MQNSGLLLIYIYDNNIQIPNVSERQVWQALRGLQRTAVGPANIPYWIWKDLADVFTPVICKLRPTQTGRDSATRIFSFQQQIKPSTDKNFTRYADQIAKIA
jgi:hypothetical protein